MGAAKLDRVTTFFAVLVLVCVGGWWYWMGQASGSTMRRPAQLVLEEHVTMASWKHRKPNGAIVNVVARLSDVGGDLVAFEALIVLLERLYEPNVDLPEGESDPAGDGDTDENR